MSAERVILYIKTIDIIQKTWRTDVQQMLCHVEQMLCQILQFDRQIRKYTEYSSLTYRSHNTIDRKIFEF